MKKIISIFTILILFGCGSTESKDVQKNVVTNKVFSQPQLPANAVLAPDFNKLYKKHHDSGLEIVGITLTSGSPANIQLFMDQWKMNYMVLTDIKGNETQDVTTLYGKATSGPIVGIPTTFLIDRNGYIVKRYLGPRSEEIFYNDIKPYL